MDMRKAAVLLDPGRGFYIKMRSYYGCGWAWREFGSFQSESYAEHTPCLWLASHFVTRRDAESAMGKLWTIPRDYHVEVQAGREALQEFIAVNARLRAAKPRPSRIAAPQA